MEKWNLDSEHPQPILTHFCDQMQPDDSSSILRQDLGGGYVRCDRCGDKYLPEPIPGNPRMIFRVKSASEAAIG